MNKKKMKQALALLCAGAMTVTGMNLPVNVLSIKAVEQVQNESSGETSDVTSDSIVTAKGLKKIDSAILMENAKANSEQNPAEGADGPASWAFNNNDANWWHSRWGGTAQAQAGESRPDGNLDNMAQNGSVWIQTGFGETKTIKEIGYVSRTDGKGNFNAYKVLIANTPDKEEPADSDFKEVKAGNLSNTRAEQRIVLDTAQEATHVRIEVSSIYKNGGNNYPCAKHIYVYEETEVQYDLNKQEEFWDYELVQGTLADQTDADRWHYQIKESGEWKDLPASAYNASAMKWMDDGRTYHYGKLAKNEITSTLSDGNAAHEAVAFAWKASREGYYRATLEEAMINTNQSKLNFVVGHAKSGETGDGKILLQESLGNGQTFTSKIAKVSAGDWIRIGATKHNAWAQNFLPMVEEVTAKDYAGQYLEEVADVENQGVYTEESKKAVVDARAALQTAVDATAPNMTDIEAKIAALEETIKNLVSELDVAIAEAEDRMEEEGYEQKYTLESRNVLEEALELAFAAQGDTTMTPSEIQLVIDDLNEALENLEVQYAVTIKNGTSPEKVEYHVAGESVKVVAEPAPEGQKFAYWTVDGTPISYEASYTFTVLGDMTVEAVYVTEGEAVEQQATILCTSYYDTKTLSATFTAKRSVPEGCTVIEHGILMTDSTGWSNLGEDGFVIGAERTVKGVAKTTGLVGNYTYRMKSTRQTTWYGKGYVTYTDKDGQEHTLYSEVTSCEVIQ